MTESSRDLTIPSSPSQDSSAPVCAVVVLTEEQGLVWNVRETLADARTSVSSRHSLDALLQYVTFPDVVLIDVSRSGSTTVRSILSLRRRWPCVILIALSVPDAAAAIDLLAWGVDEAIERDTHWPYLAARLGAAARRARTANSFLRRRVGDIVYDRENRHVWCAGASVPFSPRELAVFDCLWWRAGETVSCDTINEYVWAENRIRSNRLEVYISFLRAKLRGSREAMIETVRGRGYRLAARAENSAQDNVRRPSG